MSIIRMQKNRKGGGRTSRDQDATQDLCRKPYELTSKKTTVK